VENLPDTGPSVLDGSQTSGAKNTLAKNSEVRYFKRMTSIKGSCLCGEIAFEMTGEPKLVNHCHCSRCRKVRGTANATNLVVALDGLNYVRGAELLTTYKVPEARYFTHAFCSRCGSSMPRLDVARGIAIVPMGSFDDDPGIRPTRHIFVESRATWDEIYDSLPQIPGAPPPL
jgi:hypothetical protein